MLPLKLMQCLCINQALRKPGCDCLISVFETSTWRRVGKVQSVSRLLPNADSSVEVADCTAFWTASMQIYGLCQPGSILRASVTSHCDRRADLRCA